MSVARSHCARFAVRGSLVVLCWSITPLLAWAQTPAPEVPAATDLLSAYRAALANDPQFASARAQSLAQREKLTQGRAGLLPQVGGAWSSTRVIFDQKAPAEFNKTFSSTGWTLSLSQPLFRWDRWETYKQGEIAAQAAEASLAQAQLDLITRTAQAYFDVLNAQDTLRADLDAQAAYKRQLDEAQKKFEVGLAAITDVQATLSDVDVVLFLVESGRFGPDDEKVLALCPKDKPVFLVANKLDLVGRREELLPWLQSMQQRHPFTEIVPLSAQKEADTKRLLDIIRPYVPQQPWWYDQDALTDRTDRFLASEIIREKLFRLTGDELPYTSTVVIDSYQEEAPTPGRKGATGLIRIAATIIVERDAHKGMVIGDKGERLKRIGSEARTELERLQGRKVFLELWVKVRSGWADDDARLRTYGYE